MVFALPALSNTSGPHNNGGDIHRIIPAQAGICRAQLAYSLFRRGDVSHCISGRTLGDRAAFDRRGSDVQRLLRHLGVKILGYLV